MVTEQSVLVGMAPLSLGLSRDEWEPSLTPQERTRLAREAIALLEKIEKEYPTDIRGGATMAARLVIEEQLLEINRLIERLRVSESNPHKPRK
jgi:hypothetical protein